MRLRPETIRRAEQWKKNNPDYSWDILMNAALEGTNVPRNRCQAILDHKLP